MDAFEKQTRKLVEDLGIRRADLREAARQQAIEHFEPKKITRQFCDLLERVIKREIAGQGVK